MKQEYMTPPPETSNIAEDIKPKTHEDVKAEIEDIKPQDHEDVKAEIEDIKPQDHENIKAWIEDTKPQDHEDVKAEIEDIKPQDHEDVKAEIEDIKPQDHENIKAWIEDIKPQDHEDVKAWIEDIKPQDHEDVKAEIEDIKPQDHEDVKAEIEDIKPQDHENIKAWIEDIKPQDHENIKAWIEDIKPKDHEDVKAKTEYKAPSLPIPSPEIMEPRRVLWEDRIDQQATPVFSDPAPTFVQPLKNANILVAYGLARQRLLLFDYDGTLTDIVPNPRDALLGEPVFDELRKLASHPKNTVWIISGRDRYFLEKEPGRVAELGLIAEHGAFMRYPGTTEWQDICGGVDMSWQDRVESVMRGYKAAHPLSAIERKSASVVWHYRNAKLTSDLPAEGLKTELENTLGFNDPVEVKRGKCIVEVRLKFINKGQIASKLAQEYEPKFVLCAGDDVTDEGNPPSTRTPFLSPAKQCRYVQSFTLSFQCPFETRLYCNDGEVRVCDLCSVVP